MAVRASAACTSGEASRTIARSMDALVKRGRDAIGLANPGPHDPILRMTRALLANARVESDDHSAALRTDGFGTLADFAAIIEAELQAEVKSHEQGQATKPAKP